MDWAGIWNSIKTFFNTNIWNIIGFVAVFIIGLCLIKIVLNIFRRFMSKTKMEKVTQSFIYKVIKFIFYLIFIMILLNMLGISMTGVVTAVSACLLAVGMALQNNIANLANGIVIVSSKIIRKGDFIECSGVSGSIEDINFLFTTIMTTDNKKITLPNSSLVNNALVNYGANKTRRVDFTFSVAYESDVEKVRNIILSVMHSNGNVRVDEKAPFCKLKTLNASSIDFFANCWVDTEDYWDVYYYVIENVFNEFKRNNISIPYNQLEIRERKDDVVMPVIEQKLQDRVEKVRIKQKQLIDLEKDDLMALFKRKNGKDNKVKMKKSKKSAEETTEEKTENK